MRSTTPPLQLVYHLTGVDETLLLTTRILSEIDAMNGLAVYQIEYYYRDNNSDLNSASWHKSFEWIIKYVFVP